jgi:UDP-N-acetylmuramoyl-tripeptide--D-alanyl-D-alanine ligase
MVMKGTLIQNEQTMMKMTVQEICRACEGELLAGSPLASVSGVSTDTRADLEGSLFIGLKGENFDGGDFIGAALAGGAMGIMASAVAARRLLAEEKTAELRDRAIIAVEDTGEALKRLGTLAAQMCGAPIVAITGSSGKTSTKDILAGLLGSQLNVVSGRGSFNNEIGVPLTLLGAADDTDVIVVEMGMQAPGEISELCRIAAPDIAVITNIGPAHLEHSDSMDNIAAGKAEIAACLTPGGGLVVPFNEELLKPHLEDLDVEVLTFGFDAGADIHPVSETTAADRLHAVVDCCGAKLELTFNFAARHHLLNAMAAIGAYRLLGLPLDNLAAAAAGVNLSHRRGEHLRLSQDILLINDCYNANPLSMESALEHLARSAAGRRTVAILGDMGELGSEASAYHRQVGRTAARLGIDSILAIGELAAGYVEGAAEEDRERDDRHCINCDIAVRELEVLLEPGDIVLVKASRFMRLERITDALADSRPAGEETGKGG